MDIYGKIGEMLREMNSGKSSSLFPATVKSVDGQTCTVDMDGLELTDVRLRAAVNDEETGMLVTPSKGSIVMVTDLGNGDLRDLAVVMYSEIDKVEFNSGKNGGLINIKDLVDHINTIEKDINTLKNIFASFVPVPQDGGAALKAAAATWSAQTITTTKVDDIEDDKITH